MANLVFIDLSNKVSLVARGIAPVRPPFTLTWTRQGPSASHRSSMGEMARQAFSTYSMRP